MSQEQLAKKLGKPRATIANTVRLINIDIALQDYVANGELTAGHAKAILALKSGDEQRKAADVIMAKDMNVRQAEEYVRKLLLGEEELSKPEKPVEVENEQIKLSIKETEVKLKKILGSKTKIKLSDPTIGKGKLVIDYKNYDDLNRLLELIGE